MAGEDDWAYAARRFLVAASQGVPELMRLPNGLDAVSRLFDPVGIVSGLLLDRQTGTDERLRGLLEAKDDQLRLTTHELRRPLGVANGHLSLILEGTYGEVPEGMREAFGAIHSGIIEIGTLLEGLAEAVRLEDRAEAVRRQATRIGHLVADAIEAGEAAVGGRGVTVEADLPDPDVLASVDRRQLRIAVVNLVGNAVKYSPDGAQVRVRVRSDESRFSISVIDQGPGIDPAEAERIFESWHRSPDVAGPGLGLGLYIVRQVVELHGGRVELESEPGAGATFTIVLPR